MKILISSIVDLQKSAHHSRLHKFIHHLSNNHQITVISINDFWKEDFESRSKEVDQDLKNLLDRIEIRYLTLRRISPILQEIFSPLLLERILKKGEEKEFDIHFNYNSLILGYAVSRIMKKVGVNTVFDIADDLPGMIKESPQIPVPLRSIGAYIGEIAVRRNISISAITTYTTDLLRETYSPPESQTAIISNGVDIESTRSTVRDCSLGKRLNIENRFVVGFVGTLREWVDFEPVFKAVLALKNRIPVMLLVVGGGNSLEKTIRTANGMGLSDDVIFTGTVPHNDIWAYISLMDICLIPFKPGEIARGSLPLKLFEYMACSKPVITTKIEAISSIIGDNALYASDEHDYERTILELYESDVKRKEMGRIGRGIVESQYDWQTIVPRLEELLVRLSR